VTTVNAIRQIFQSAPDTVAFPPAPRHRRVEVVLLAIDEAPIPAEAIGLPSEWPEGFFEQTAGALPDLPDRDPQGEHPAPEPTPGIRPL
jgi:hypothetical protein